MEEPNLATRQGMIMDTAVRAELGRYEAVIKRGLATFVEVGNALSRIRDDGLYRQDYATFEEYCVKRWDIKRQRAYELMEAASIGENLSEISDIDDLREAHVAPLAKLEPGKQREVYLEAKATAPDGKITAAHMERTVERLKRPKSAPTPPLAQPTYTAPLPMTTRDERRCVGFGEFTGKCNNVADGKNPNWCDRCDDLRMAYLDKRFDEIAKAAGIDRAEIAAETTAETMRHLEQAQASEPELDDAPTADELAAIAAVEREREQEDEQRRQREAGRVQPYPRLSRTEWLDRQLEQYEAEGQRIADELSAERQAGERAQSLRDCLATACERALTEFIPLFPAELWPDRDKLAGDLRGLEVAIMHMIGTLDDLGYALTHKEQTP